jgi:transcriptional regulator with XRE-family HTH domain
MILRMVYNPQDLPKAVRDGLLDHGVPVRAAREAAGFSIQELAGMTGISVSRIEAFERSETVPSPDEADALAVATGTLADLFFE